MSSEDEKNPGDPGQKRRKILKMIKIATLNANGLRDPNKRSKLGSLAKIIDPDFLLLQETHCIQGDRWLEREWPGHHNWTRFSNRTGDGY